VVLLEIDVDSIVAFELECNASRPVDVDRIAGGAEAFQGVEVKTGQVHFFWARRGVQAVKSNDNAFVHSGVDLCGLSRLEEVCQSFVPERLDHAHCKQSADKFQVNCKQIVDKGRCRQALCEDGCGKSGPVEAIRRLENPPIFDAFQADMERILR
jgi:hypothetical protein